MRGQTLLGDPETARRLSKASGEILIPLLVMDKVAVGLGGLVASFISLLGPVADLFMHVLYIIVETAFPLIWGFLLMVLKAIGQIFLMLVESGMLAEIMNLALDILIILMFKIAMPMLFAVLDMMMCIFDLFAPSGWPEQLKCINKRCFGSSTDTTNDMIIFTSAPILYGMLHDVVSTTLNSKTGRTFLGNEFDLGSSYWGPSTIPALQTDGCASCFVCKVPELRLLSLLVMSIVGCVSPANYWAYRGSVTDQCVMNGGWYIEACGPRSADALPLGAWQGIYTKHREMEPVVAQRWATLFLQKSKQWGGSGDESGQGFQSGLVAGAWFGRPVTDPENEGAGFMRQICRAMRSENVYDVGTDYTQLPAESMAYESSRFLYEECRAQQNEMCYSPFGRWLITEASEWQNCVEPKPACYRRRQSCLGTCGGGTGTKVRQDFCTTVSKTELSERAIGIQRISRGVADCNVRNVTLEIAWFDGGLSHRFREFAADARVRSGMSAISPKQCGEFPRACAAIKKVIASAPRLTWIPGRGLVRSNTLLPPPPPSPPPASNLAGRPQPPPPPPPPATPPPWYSHVGSLKCPFDILTAEEVYDDAAKVENSRSLCIFTKRVLDIRRDASDCFSHESPSPPPSFEQPGQKQQETPETEKFEHDAQADATRAVTASMVTALAAENPALRDLLKSAATKLLLQSSESANSGRQLFEAAPRLNLAAQHVAGGTSGETLDIIHSIELSECAAICEAIRRNTSDRDDPTECKAYAFKMEDPADAFSQTVSCRLLKSTGSCEVVDFASMLVRKFDVGACDLPSSSYNPTCLELPSSRDDARVLDYASSAELCRSQMNIENDEGLLPHPLTALEAMIFVASARSMGVYSFWARKPEIETFEQELFWPSADGSPFRVPANDSRCILVNTEMGSRLSHMYAHSSPCGVKLADGIICEQLSAFPPSPPAFPKVKLRPPPPPPFLRERSLADFSRSTVKPMTQTICTSASEGRLHKNVCTFMIDQLSKRQTVGFLVGVVPLCEPVCWNACQGEDSFATCKRAECAAADCLSFLINECPPAMSNAFRNQHNARCSLVPPLPPPPPTPPPQQSPPANPPSPPRKPPADPPPPIVPAYELRFSNSEASWLHGNSRVYLCP